MHNNRYIKGVYWRIILFYPVSYTAEAIQALKNYDTV